MKPKRKEKEDEYSALIKKSLAPHFGKANVVTYRYNSVSVRVRIVHQSFEGKSLIEREKSVQQYLDELPADVRSDITVLLLLTEDELSSSLMNYEFEHPSASTL